MSTQAAIRSILVPTDFSEDAQVAFFHALRLSIALKAQLEILHVEPENDQSDWRWGPHLVSRLIKWGYLKEGATEADLPVLGIHVRKQLVVGTDVVTATLREVASTHADLVVIATHGRTGVQAWLQPSVAAPLALKGAVPVLVIPPGMKGFVDGDTGGITLDRVLLPVDHRPHPAPAFDAAAILLRAAGGNSPRIATMHVGETPPETGWLPEGVPGDIIHWRADGSVIDTLVSTAKTWSASLVICVTEGRRGIADVLRGSTVERLLQELPAPLLIVPNEWGTDQVGTD